jgi:hypothetical protein
VRAALRFFFFVCLAAAALALPLAASAEPASTSFTIVGYEYAFTSTIGSFAGSGRGNAGDTAVWNAYVKHDRLGSTPTYVNGGSFAMTTSSPSRFLDAVSGTFAYHEGTITTLDRGANCTNQRYLVTGTLKDVATSTSTGGSGDLEVTLTHYRARVLGHCIAYKARVSGTVTFTF